MEGSSLDLPLPPSHSIPLRLFSLLRRCCSAAGEQCAAAGGAAAAAGGRSVRNCPLFQSSTDCGGKRKEGGRARQRGEAAAEGQGREEGKTYPPTLLSLSLSPSQWLEVLRERLPESQLDLLAQVTRQQQQEGEGEATVRALLLLRGSVDLEPGAHLLR